ncbi:MAG: P-II family nitrogen regulator [Clostridiales bacterium]|jgi:nitrogen regulatory protein PII|nr:P-II family nitrogen regulator [Clostridiales bacterium]
MTPDKPGQSELICAIINQGTASKLIRFAKQHGIYGATVVMGKGTVGGSVLKFLGLSETRKEIVLMVAEKSAADSALEMISKEFEFHKPNHGIAFTSSLYGVLGSSHIACGINLSEGEAESTMYNIITAIVEKGKAEDVISAAAAVGSKGGTIVNARGSGIHETSKLFSMEIEPEKEIVLILSEHDMTESIVKSIGEKLKIDKPGNGIIYVQNANKTYGIYK